MTGPTNPEPTDSDRLLDIQNELADIRGMLKDLCEWVNKTDKEFHTEPIYIPERRR